MKRITTLLFAAGLLAAFTTGCKEEYKTYSDAEYVLFTDTMSVNMVLQDRETFRIPVSATTACDYDRTFGVEIIDKGSKAIEGVHYRLESNTITIKAGTRSTDVVVHGRYDELKSDTMNFHLALVLPDEVKWNLYGVRTHVKMVKSCPYALDDFTGWCVVTSTFLNEFPGVENKSIQRLIRTEKHATEENTVVMHDFLFTGYDITLRLDPTDPAEPIVTMEQDQVIADEFSVLGQILGDNRLLAGGDLAYNSTFNTCKKSVRLFIQVYVRNLGTNIGMLGSGYLHIIEWISDEEADRLRREEGM